MQPNLPRRTRLSCVALLLFVTACDTDLPSGPTPTGSAGPTATPQTTSVSTPIPSSPTAPPTTAPPTLPPTLPPSSTGTQTPAASQTQTPYSVLNCAPDAGRAERDSIGDPLYPQLGNSGYDALSYTLDLSVDVERDVVTGTTTMRAVAAKVLSGFNLDFGGGLKVNAVRVNDADARFNSTRHELEITPSSPLKAGASFTVTVAYGGEPNTQPVDTIPGERYALGWSHYDKGVFVASEPSGAASFFPVNDHPCDKATYNMSVTVPKPYTVAANGMLKEAKDLGAATTYTFDTRDPMASYLVTLNIAEFNLQTQEGPNGLPIRNYFAKGLNDSVRIAFQRTPEMIDYFNKLYGPYPFDVYGVVVIDEPLGFALETQTLSLFGRPAGSGRVEAEQVTAHELSHQWFGDSVSLASWGDIWLNEGFASMSEWLWIEHDRGANAYESYVQGIYDYAQGSDLGPPGSPSADSLFDPSVYLRGGLTLYALRKEVGDDAFFKTLQTYMARYRNANARTQDFMRVAGEVSGKQLDSLFNAWLYESDLPPLP